MTQQRERAINAPWPVVLLVLGLIGGYALQGHSQVEIENVASVWGFAPADLGQRRYLPLVTSIFLHGSWTHVLGNAAFALAFATPVARRLGHDTLGAMSFFVFFLTCGVLGNLGYAALSPGGLNSAVGASGAIAGMMGAASRLIGRSHGLNAFASRPVVSMALVWGAINLIFGLVLIGWTPGAGGMPIAWQVHLAGYAAGLCLFAPLLSLIGRRAAGDHGIES